MNPNTHIRLPLGVLIITLALLAMACGASATDDSSLMDASSDGTATVLAVEKEDAHDSETRAMDAHDDAHNGEPMVMESHDDNNDTNSENVIEITLNVVEGKAPWGFDLEVIEIQLGQRVKLTLNNSGRAEHDVEISNLMAEHIETMAGMAHGDRLGGHSNTVVAAHAMPGTAASVTFTPTMAGEYEFHCTIPGHRELGMVGKIIVTNGVA